MRNAGMHVAGRELNVKESNGSGDKSHLLLTNWMRAHITSSSFGTTNTQAAEAAQLHSCARCEERHLLFDVSTCTIVAANAENYQATRTGRLVSAPLRLRYRTHIASGYKNPYVARRSNTTNE
ncbi:hypothetical protein LSTR_LSTR012931 [Laodelphax striatellus]|uniref:Uncharacterized protein n=1 Tax=Laodelphax striatellus TaxID=195883 RepID=A0A482X8A4_LAOST|nr:hypothetical protein LSTR_LSTR012931 [Laodelphax striatellus]